VCTVIERPHGQSSLTSVLKFNQDPQGGSTADVTLAAKRPLGYASANIFLGERTYVCG
jgi:hypothetical protein